jgi:transposase
MKKVIITEKDRQNIISQKEKAIMESFASTYNKIKRLDETEEISEIFGWSDKEKQGKSTEKAQQFDQSAQAYLQSIQSSPKFVEIAKQQIEKNKQSAIQNAISRDKEMGSKGNGKFKFITNTKVTPPQVVVQYELGNYIPSTGMGQTPTTEE